MSRVLEPDELPGAPIGDRVLLLPDPPLEESEHGIILPGIAQHRPNTGKLISAGLSALDKIHDQGMEIGDDVVWGQFAGVIWEWDHVKEYGKKPCTMSQHLWGRAPSPRSRVSAKMCDECGTTRWIEFVLLANVDDIQSSVNLEQRKRNGVVAVKRGKTADGQTMHFIDRKDS